MVSVCQEEIDRFVGSSVLIRNWLKRYAEGKSRKNHVYVLCRFFKWLRLEGLTYNVEDFLEVHLKKRSSSRVEDRCWALNLALGFSRDNEQFKGLSRQRRYFMFCTVKNFFDFCEAPLTTAKNVYGGGKKGRKYKRRQISVDDVRRVLGQVSQCYRTVLLVMLQSGMEIGAVLNKFNYMLDYVTGCIRAGQERVRIDIKERKGNATSYFTFISRDAIHELKKWLHVRDKILEKHPNEKGRK